MKGGLYSARLSAADITIEILSKDPGACRKVRRLLSRGDVLQITDDNGEPVVRICLSEEAPDWQMKKSINEPLASVGKPVAPSGAVKRIIDI